MVVRQDVDGRVIGVERCFGGMFHKSGLNFRISAAWSNLAGQGLTVTKEMDMAGALLRFTAQIRAEIPPFIVEHGKELKVSGVFSENGAERGRK